MNRVIYHNLTFKPKYVNYLTPLGKKIINFDRLYSKVLRNLFDVGRSSCFGDTIFS